MKTFLEKLSIVVHALENQHGPLMIFGLFLREQPLEKWDVVVSAQWLKSDDITAFRLVNSHIQQKLNENELIQISRIVILDYNDPAVSYLQNEFEVTNGHYDEIPANKISEKFGFTIKRAYLLRCQKIEDIFKK
jgi:hypothetical protein